MLGGVEVISSKETKYLGVPLDQNLICNQHTDDQKSDHGYMAMQTPLWQNLMT